MQSKPVPHADVRAELDRVLASETFQGANRSRRLLEFIVQAVLEGRAAQLKEYTLGADALGRGAAFDPRIDPIARVEASRLRRRLEHYYATEGSADPVQILLPKGGYAPSFTHASTPPRTEQPAAPPPAGAHAEPMASRLRRAGAVAWFGSGAIAAVAAALVIVWLSQPTDRPADSQAMHLDVAVGAPGTIAADVGNSIAVTPDGSTLVLVILLDDGSTRLYVRGLGELGATELPGTVGARGPFISPDGRWVGFWAEGKLKKTLLDGRASPVILTDATDLLGASWDEDGHIVATLGRRNVLWRVPEQGGAPVPLLDFGEQAAHPRWVQVLPGAKAVLFTATMGQGSPSRIEVASIEGGAHKTLLPNGTYARFLPSGHIVYLDRGTLFAVPFDLERLEIAGVPAPVLSDVAYGEGFGFAHFDIAHDGTLAYLRSVSSGLSTIAWLDGDRVVETLSHAAGRYLWPRLSPDGQRLAYSLLDGSDADLWILDLTTGARTRATAGGGSQGSPLWMPDSQSLLYAESAVPALVWLRADGSGQRHTLLSGGIQVPWSFSPDGGRLAYHQMGADTGFDLWTVPIESGPDGVRTGEPEPFRRTGSFETYPTFSPDGRWIAYGSNESGVWEVYVRAFPDDGRQVRVSSSGGRIPAWSRSDERLFYGTNDRRIMVTEYTVRDGDFVAATPRLWSERQLADTGVLANFDLAENGAHVVALIPAADGGHTARNHVTLVVDFFRLLQP
jgi:eukaryotic-like serine/threonine-protein kinase